MHLCVIRDDSVSKKVDIVMKVFLVLIIPFRNESRILAKIFESFPASTWPCPISGHRKCSLKMTSWVLVTLNMLLWLPP